MESFAVTARSQLRAKVTRLFNDRANFVSYDPQQRLNIKFQLQKVDSELVVANEKVAALKFEEEMSVSKQTEELTACEQYTDKICQCLAALESSAAPPTTPQNTYGAVRSEARSLLKSPTAPLPRFNSTKGENFELFLSQFEETLSKFSYTEYDKLLLLKQQITGRALHLIDSLESNNQTYIAAKELLRKALASVPVQKANIIREMCSLKLNYGDEPFKYIGDIRKIMESVKTLKINIDDVMQYFFFNGLNETFQEELTIETRNIRPTLSEIVDNFFAANERYELALANRKSDHKIQCKVAETETTTLSSKVTKAANPFVNCSLCDGATHAINKCTRYVKPVDKINRLKSINGCVRCGNSDHSVSGCHFRFKKSCKCKKWHFTFLCPEPVDETEASVAQNSKFNNDRTANRASGSHNPKVNTSVSSVVASLFENDINHDAILSTFTTNLPNDMHPVRALMDFGSQSSFISEKLLVNQNYKMLDDNVNVQVSGINETRSYQSKLVEVDLTFGSKIYPVKLLTLPKIDISLNLKKLPDVVSKFRSLNYNLADKMLKDDSTRIDNIDLLLGANASHCFEGRYAKFGNNSVYFETSFGVLLLGDTEELLKDLPSLPQNEANTASFAINIRGAKSEESLRNEPLVLKDDYPLVSKNSLPDIEKLGPEALDKTCSFILEKSIEVEVDYSEQDKDSLEYLVTNCTRSDDGRLIIPLLWNPKVKHLLSKNFKLSKSILNSNLKKLEKNRDNLLLVDQNFKELEALGIIEKIPNLDQFMIENPTCSFLGHMQIFKPHKETTKVRSVFLSNLSDKSDKGISHNQAMYSGPCMNQKLSTSLILLRFDEKLLCFDLAKAFLQIELPESDKNKLLFLWFRNVARGDFTIQAWRNNRLTFGLRCSPTILMVGLFKILLLDESDSEELNELKKLIYSLIYVDNGAVTMSTSEKICWAYEKLNSIFEPYQFKLQQFSTNDSALKSKIDQTEPIVDLFGLKWNTVDDTISIKKVNLDPTAKSKRLILTNIASVFDPFNYEGPMLNRARLFLHGLQSQTKLGWDTPLGESTLREWANIAKQYNASEPVCIPRFVGDRTDEYRLIAFVDASTQIYGCVLFIQSIRTDKPHFLFAKNKIVGKQMETKTVPTLELSAIEMGAEWLKDTKKELAGSQCIVPIKITELKLFSDSLVALSWLNSYVTRLEKMNKVSTFVKNRLGRIAQLCEDCPMTFSFIDGISNPADCISRPMSLKTLLKSNYYSGPAFLTESQDSVSKPDILQVTVPNPNFESTSLQSTSSGVNEGESDEVNPEVNEVDKPSELEDVNHLIPLDRFSSFNKLIRIYRLVYKYINKLKEKVNSKVFTPPRPSQDGTVLFKDRPSQGGTVLFKDRPSQDRPSQDRPSQDRPCQNDVNLFQKSLNTIISIEQKRKFYEIYEYFSKASVPNRVIPNLVTQLNLFLDSNGLLRVGSKMMRNRKSYFPLLLPKCSILTDLIIVDIHQRLSHSGIYPVLSELRKQFWVPCVFSVVKRLLRLCVHCKRYNGRTVQLNQGMYRDFRVSPNEVPFANMFLDYAGPFTVHIGHEATKVYVLVITCLYTRAVNLVVSVNLTVEEFIRALSLHSFEYGVPLRVISDAGTQIVAGADVIGNFLNDQDTKLYFEENGCGVLAFEQFYKGKKELGGLVECCVKMCKRLLSGSMGKNVLSLREFEYFVAQAKHLINRRPVAFKNSLRDTSSSELPEPITPERLIHGHDLISVNLIPSLQMVDDDSILDPDYDINSVRSIDRKLKKVRSQLFKVYHAEFLPQLVYQATDDQKRYTPVSHTKLEVGDIVLIKEDMTKRSNFPMARVVDVQVNNLGEVTGASLVKGSSGEIVKRHSCTLIPLLTDESVRSGKVRESKKPSEPPIEGKSSQKRRRAAAVSSEQRTRAMLLE